MKAKRIFLYVSALLLVIVPLAIYELISARDTHFDEVVNQYECHGEKCEADFDGDGIAGYVEQTMDDSAAPSNRLLVVFDNNQELLRQRSLSILTSKWTISDKKEKKGNGSDGFPAQVQG